MPVTIKIAQHLANLCYAAPHSVSNSLFEQSCPNELKNCKEVIQSSLNLNADNNNILPSSNGFVEGAVNAYSYHHHLVIRPDDIWFAILTQMSIYINKNAETLRGKFVSHEGKKDLKVILIGNRFSADNAILAEKMTHLIQENVVDPELRAWIIPAFTTTSRKDEVVASILMMGALQKYFSYYCSYLCGIPSVTLLGEEADWEEISLRLEKLQTFGEEPARWYHLLKPVLSRFVKTFSTPQAPEISDFWGKMVNRQSGSGVDEISGWLSAFCFWKEDGQLMYQPAPLHVQTLDYRDGVFVRNLRPTDKFCLDGQVYGEFDLKDMPRGYATVPVHCDDNGYEFDAVMLAGFIGIKCSSSGQKTAKDQIGLDTVQAESGWLMFEKK